MIRIIGKSLLLALLLGVATTRLAFAYIDPATGGMLFQALAAALAVFTGLALVFSRQIRTLLARIRRRLRHETEAEAHNMQEAAVTSKLEKPGDH
jgi:membrane protein implicated in regulation of membrane protease activity